MPLIHLPAALTSFTDRKKEIQVQGTNIYSCLKSLIQLYPALKGHLFNEKEEIYRFVSLHCNEQHILPADYHKNFLQDTDRLAIVPAIAGG